MAKVYRAAVIGTSRMGAFIDNEIPLVEVSPPSGLHRTVEPTSPPHPTPPTCTGDAGRRAAY